MKISTASEPAKLADSIDEIIYKNNVQIIPSNFLQTDKNAITTVQVISDENLLANQIKDVKSVKMEQASTSTASILCAKNNIDPTTSTSTSASTSTLTSKVIETLPKTDERVNARQFGGVVTNISIGCKEKSIFLQTINPKQPEPLHYEKVFVTQSPTITTIPTTIGANNADQSENVPSEVHVNRIKLNKNETTQRTQADINVEPSTSTSNTVTFSVSAATGSNANANTQLTSTKPKDAIAKCRAVEAKHENDSIHRPLLTRGLTEAIIIRPSRKDTNMLLNRANQPGIHVCSFFIDLQFNHLEFV